MTQIRASRLVQPSLFATPARVMLDLHLAFLPEAGMSKREIGERLVSQLMHVGREMEPLEFFSVVAHQAKHQSVRAQALQGLGVMLLGGDVRRYDFPTFPSHSHTPQEVGAEIARTASEVSSVEFREASIQLLANCRNKPELDKERLTLLLKAVQWPYRNLQEAALGGLEVRDRYHPLFELWRIDNPLTVTGPVQKQLDWLRRTCPSRDHGQFEPLPKSNK